MQFSTSCFSPSILCTCVTTLEIFPKRHFSFHICVESTSERAGEATKEWYAHGGPPKNEANEIHPPLPRSSPSPREQAAAAVIVRSAGLVTENEP